MLQCRSHPVLHSVLPYQRGIQLVSICKTDAESTPRATTVQDLLHLTCSSCLHPCVGINALVPLINAQLCIILRLKSQDV